MHTSGFLLPYGDRGRFQYLPYDERSPRVFQLVADLIEHEDDHLAVEHIGSTAVPGCPGKGFIDVLVLSGSLPGRACSTASMVVSADAPVLIPAR